MKELILTVLLFWSSHSTAQMLISDRSVVPVGPTYHCQECDPLNKSDPEVVIALNKSVRSLWILCWDSGMNQWEHEASVATCGRGIFHVDNAWGDWATYVYNDINVENETVKFGLLYYGFLNPFGLDLKMDRVVP